MKKNKHKALVKEQKKVAKKELTDQISGAIHAVVLNLGLSGKKIEKLINKNAKQLAKKVQGMKWKAKGAKLKINSENTASSSVESEQTNS